MFVCAATSLEMRLLLSVVIASVYVIPFFGVIFLHLPKVFTSCFNALKKTRGFKLDICLNILSFLTLTAHH